MANGLWWQRRSPVVLGPPMAALIAASPVAAALRWNALAVFGLAGLIGLAGVLVAVPTRAKALRTAAPNYPLAVGDGDETGPVVVRQRSLEIALGVAWEAATLALLAWLVFGTGARPWSHTRYGNLVRILLLLTILQNLVTLGRSLLRPWGARLDNRGVTTGGVTVGWPEVRGFHVEAAGQQWKMRWTYDGGSMVVPVFDPAPAIRFTRAHLAAAAE